MTGGPGFRALAVAVVSLAALVPRPLAANDLEDELERVARRIEEVASMIDEITETRSALAGEIKEAAGRLDELEAQLEAAADALGRVTARVEAQRDLARGISERLRGAFEELTDIRAAIAVVRVTAIASARSAYITGSGDAATLSVGAADFNDFAVGLEYLARAGRTRQHALATHAMLEDREASHVDSIAAEEAALRAHLTDLESLEADLEAVQSSYEARRAEMVAAVAVQAHLLETLDEEIAHFEAELEGLQADQGGLRRRISREQSVASSAAAPAITATGFVRPVPGAITSGFGPRYHPVLGYSRPHTGVDFRASHGQPIKAAQAGVVILANVWGGYGRTVVIDHGGGLATLYAHQSSLAVSYGDRVAAGDLIGKVGTSGLSTGPHLHFEVRIGGEPVDPIPYLSG